MLFVVPRCPRSSKALNKRVLIIPKKTLENVRNIEKSQEIDRNLKKAKEIIGNIKKSQEIHSKSIRNLKKS